MPFLAASRIQSEHWSHVGVVRATDAESWRVPVSTADDLDFSAILWRGCELLLRSSWLLDFVGSRVEMPAEGATTRGRWRFGRRRCPTDRWGVVVGG